MKKKYTFMLVSLSIIGIVIPILCMLPFKMTQTSSQKEAKCPDGYIPDGDKCSKTVTIDRTEIKFCDGGFELVGNMCEKIETTALVPKYSCVTPTEKDISGPELIGSSCKYIFNFDPVEVPKCPTGCGFLTETECVCSLDVPAAIRSLGGHQNYYCPNGILNGTICTIVSYPTPTIDYVCVQGYSLVNGKCQKAEYISAIIDYVCPSGYIKGNYGCEKKVTESPIIRYDCAETYTMTNDKCEKTLYAERR